MPELCEKPMTQLHLPFAQLKAAAITCLGAVAMAIVLSACASDPAVVIGEPIVLPASSDFCAAGQRQIAQVRIPVQTVVHRDYEAFVQSKPSIKPLEVQQYTAFADNAGTQPKMISCKFKSADHIRSEYGANAAGEPASCASLNRRSLDAVMASLTRKERKKLLYRSGTAVLLEPDEMAAIGPEWLKPFEMSTIDMSGTLRIRAKAMRNDWNDPKLANAPARLKGTHYCHLIAPEYLKALLIGAAKPGV
jgi:hypothetical protein